MGKVSQPTKLQVLSAAWKIRGEYRHEDIGDVICQDHCHCWTSQALEEDTDNMHMIPIMCLLL